MRGRLTIIAMAALVAIAAAGACANPFGRQYEYEEQIYLETDGSAIVVINGSIASFVALRNLPLDPAATEPPDREAVRALFEAAGCPNVEVGRPWRRYGRHFIGVTVETDRVAALSNCQPLAWSTYRFARTEERIDFRQELGAPDRGDAGNVNWDGSEWVGFKLHAPSRIFHHNVRRPEDDTPGEPSRGNILTWEQRLSDRLEGSPLVMEAELGPESILHRTLWLFGGSFAAALALIGVLIWLAVRRARRRVLRKPSLS